MENDLESLMNMKYRVSLHYDPDGYWVAEHPELWGCVADGETAQEALSSLDIARELWIESRLATGLDVPVPQDEPQYSGKFVLRVAKSMHRALAKEAEAEGVSLNTHISNVLASRNTRDEQPSSTPQDLQDLVWATVCAQGGQIPAQKDLWGIITPSFNTAAPRGAAAPYQIAYPGSRTSQIGRAKPLIYQSNQEKEAQVA